VRGVRGVGGRAVARAGRGQRLALLVLAVNLVGDAANALGGGGARAAIGVPIVAALIGYLLSDRVRRFFAG
jgi:hypothetical protein